MDDLEESIDNDRFLHSLESAVFTTSAATMTTGSEATTISRLYDTPMTFDASVNQMQEGDLGWRSSLFGYPPLPPGSPVVGFGFSGLEDEEEISLPTPDPG